MKRKQFAKRLISCILSVCMLMCLFVQTLGVSAETNAGNPVSMGGAALSTEWLMEPVKTDVAMGVTDASALDATAFTVKSKASGEYLTAEFADDGTVTLSTLPRDEANDAQLWVFYDCWKDDIYYYCMANLGKYITHTDGVDYPARINRSSATSFTYGRLTKSGNGEHTVNFNGSDDNSIAAFQSEDGSFSATISYRGGTSYYLTEDYTVTTPTCEVSHNKLLSETLHATKWYIEPVEYDFEYNVKGTFAECDNNHTVYTVKSTASGSYLTASYDADGNVTLTTKMRDENNDGQLWIFYDHWKVSGELNILNLGYYHEVDGVSYPAELLKGTSTIPATAGNANGGYAWRLNSDGPTQNPMDNLKNSAGAITATISCNWPYYYITEKYITDTSMNAAEKKTVYNAELDSEVCGAQSFKFTPAKYVTYYNDKGTSAEAIAYLISSEKSGAYLTANYAEDGTATMTFNTRDKSNDAQLWILRENWASVDTNWYGLINLGSAHTVEVNDEQITALYQMYYSSGSTLVTKAISDQGDGVRTWMLNGGGTADSDGHLAIGVEDIVTADGSFTATLALRNNLYVSEDTAKVDTAKNVKIAASSDNERFDIETVDKNAAYRWHIQYVATHGDVKYYTVKNVLTGTYLTMYNNGIYLAERDSDNSHQLWAFIDGSAIDASWNSVYLLRCLGHNSAEINTWSGNSELLDENGLSYYNTADKLNAGGLAWALVKNRGKMDISDDMTVVLNSYQWGEGGNYYLCSEQAIYGDVNGDNNVDIRDLVNMKKQSLSETDTSAAADMDADGMNAQSTDLSILRKILIG